jgi:hypothetical protein
MFLKFRSTLKKKGVSPLISTILIFALIMLGVGIGVIQVVPYIETAQARATLTSVQTTFNKIDSSISDLINEGISTETTGSEHAQRLVTLSKNMGTLEYSSGTNFFNMRIVDQNRELISNGSTGKEIEPLFGTADIDLGRMDYNFATTASIIPLDSWKYLKGPSQYRRRSAVAVIAPVQANKETYTDIANFTMSYSSTDYLLHLILDYRSKIVINIVFNPVPEIRISTFMIKITGSDQPIYENYRNLMVSLGSIEYDTSVYSISSSSIVTEIAIQHRINPAGGWENSWTTAYVPGFNPEHYRITMNKVIYHFTIT